MCEQQWYFTLLTFEITWRSRRDMLESHSEIDLVMIINANEYHVRRPSAEMGEVIHCRAHERCCPWSGYTRHPVSCCWQARLHRKAYGPVPRGRGSDRAGPSNIRQGLLCGIHASLCQRFLAGQALDPGDGHQVCSCAGHYWFCEPVFARIKSHCLTRQPRTTTLLSKGVTFLSSSRQVGNCSVRHCWRCTAHLSLFRHPA